MQVHSGVEVDDRAPSTPVDEGTVRRPAPAAPLGIHVTASGEHCAQVEAYLRRNGLKAIAVTLAAPDAVAWCQLRGMAFAARDQWQAADAALHQQREQADAGSPAFAAPSLHDRSVLHKGPSVLKSSGRSRVGA